MENSIENRKAKELFGEIKKRKVEDTIIIEGRTFKLHKFDPLLGNYILLQLFTVALPFGIGDMLSSAVGSEISKNNVSSKQLSKAEFIELQKDILGSVFESLPAGETPVIRTNGTYGISEIKGSSIIQLIVAELAFNYTDFFAEGLSSFLGISSQNL